MTTWYGDQFNVGMHVVTNSARVPRSLHSVQITDASRTVHVAFLASKNILSTFTTPTPTPPPHDRALEDTLGMDVNYCEGRNEPSYVSMINQYMPIAETTGRIVIDREALFGSAPTANGASWASWWGAGGAWLRDIMQQPWMPGRRIALESQKVPAIPPNGYGTSWEDGMRWRTYQIMLRFPNADVIAGLLHINECDQADEFSSWQFMTEDFADNTTPAAIAACLERQTRCARIQWEQWKKISQPAGMVTTSAHPGWLCGPSFASTNTRTGLPVGLQIINLSDMLEYNNGEVLDYWDVIDSHHHHSWGVDNAFGGYTNIVPLTGSPYDSGITEQPNRANGSAYHLWAAIRLANIVRAGAGKTVKTYPITNSEGGRDWFKVSDADPWAGTWSPNYRHYYKCLMFGQAIIYCHWFAFSNWQWFTFGHSAGAQGQNFFSESGSAVFAPYNDFPGDDTRSDINVFMKIWDFRLWDINIFTSNIVTKTWTSYNDPSTWGVCITNMAPAQFRPTSTPPNACPFPEWLRVTFSGNQVAMAAGARNVVARPVYLRSIASHTATVQIQLTGGASAKAKFRCKGYNKINGLAAKEIEVTGAVAGFQTVSLEFTPIQHGVAHLPNPCYVLLVIDHNGTGVCTFKNPTIGLTSGTVPIVNTFGTGSSAGTAAALARSTGLTARAIGTSFAGAAGSSITAGGAPWYTQQPAGSVINVVQAPTGANQIDMYADFSVSIQGQNIPVYEVMIARDGDGYPGTDAVQACGVCNFDTTGAVTATVTVSNRTVTSVVVRPLNYGVTATRSGNVITVPIPHWGKYIVQVNDSPNSPLYLFANPPEVNVPVAGPNVTIYGPGIHTIGRTTPAANRTIYIKAGAVVRGSYIIQNADIKIRGRGFLVAPNDAPTAAVHFLETSATRFTYEGITMVQENKGFCIRLPTASFGLIDNVKIFSHMDNSDGIDPTSAHDITIKNIFLNNWDDGITCKSDPGPDVYNIFVSDSLFCNRSGWRVLGSGEEGHATHRDISFKNCDIVDTHAMMILNTESGEDPLFLRWTYEDIRIERHVGHNTSGLDPEARFVLMIGRHSDFTYKNVSLTGLRPPSAMNGAIDNVKFINLRVNGTLILSDAAWGMTRTGAVTNVTYSAGGTQLVESPNNTTIPPAASIVDADLDEWTVIGGKIYLNGVVDAPTASVVLMLYLNDVVYQENSSDRWWYWNGVDFIETTDPRGVPAQSTVSIAAIELNGKKLARVSAPSYQSGYLAACEAKLPSHIRYFRENTEGMPTAAGVNYNWSATSCSWVDTMASKSFFSGYIFEPNGQTLMHDNNWNATGEAQARWRIRQLLDHLGTKLKAMLGSPGNEPDNDPLPGGYGYFATGGASVSVAMDRMLRISRITWEERNRNNSKVALLGPAIAFPTYSGGNGIFTAKALLSRNNNELLGYIDGLNIHMHTAACTRWHDFDGTAPADTAQSVHHIGRVMAELGFQKPLTSFESGYAWDNNEANGTNAKYRFGSHFCGLLRYGCCWWSLYCHAQSGHDPMNISEPTPPFAKRAWYDAAVGISEPSQYLRPANGQLTITAKTSTAFNSPPWIVLAPATSTGFPTEFSRVTITSNNIRTAGGSRNSVARPVWLPSLAARTVTANVTITGGATAKLCVFGYDKLDMLASKVVTITTSGTYTTPAFTPRQHGHAWIPDPCYALVWLDHNGTGTVDWSNVTIS